MTVPTVESLRQRLSEVLAEYLVESREDSSETVLVFHDGDEIRLWSEDDTVRAEIDTSQGGPEIWVFGPGRDDVEDFVETALWVVAPEE
ncbi:hypothetical protein OG225_11215 [Nocardia sp. NBC_01377]|uniref:hypothetical protein n=1 Tax=Nocardia sp. NBC_01377 TaxID=2903595 RepID=UPI003256569D